MGGSGDRKGRRRTREKRRRAPRAAPRRRRRHRVPSPAAPVFSPLLPSPARARCRRRRGRGGMAQAQVAVLLLSLLLLFGREAGPRQSIVLLHPLFSVRAQEGEGKPGPLGGGGGGNNNNSNNGGSTLHCGCFLPLQVGVGVLFFHLADSTLFFISLFLFLATRRRRQGSSRPNGGSRLGVQEEEGPGPRLGRGVPRPLVARERGLEYDVVARRGTRGVLVVHAAKKALVLGQCSRRFETDHTVFGLERGGGRERESMTYYSNTYYADPCERGHQRMMMP